MGWILRIIPSSKHWSSSDWGRSRWTPCEDPSVLNNEGKLWGELNGSTIMTFSQEQKRKGDSLRLKIIFTILKIRPRRNCMGSTCLSWAIIFRIWNKTFPFHLLRVDKRTKNVTLVAFDGLASLKGQVLDDIFNFNESQKIEITT